MNNFSNRIRSVWLLALVMLMSACQPIQPPATPRLVNARPTHLPKTVVDAIEAKIKQTMQTSHTPGLAVGIVISDHVVYAQGFGVADSATGKPMTPDTTIMLASVSKTFTSAAVMQMIEQGKIDLDAPITKYLPDFKMADEQYKQITIHQLLSHQSGMPDFFDLVPEYWHTNKSDNSPEALDTYVRNLQNAKLDNPPGTTWSYSTNGFIVLGDMVAKVSGESYEAYIHDHIFKPLGMDHSSFLCTELDSNSLSSPYILDETKSKAVKADFFPYNRAIAPGDGLCSNVTDMAKWMLLHLNHGTFNAAQILKPDSYNLLWKTEAKTNFASVLGPTASEYGLGWYLADLDGHRVVSHAGGTAGFHAAMLLAPNEHIGVVVLGNLLEYPAVPFYALDIGTEVLKLLWASEK